MPKYSLGLFASFVLVGAIASTPGCTSTSASASDAGAPIGSFGCCPDVIPDCGDLATGGPKTSADDRCSRGFDGVIADPNQDGWTHAVDEYGCGHWLPPPNAKTLTCGQVVSRPVQDAGVDGSDSGDRDATPDSGDAGLD
jgi:hypothetical protein